MILKVVIHSNMKLVWKPMLFLEYNLQTTKNR